MSVLKAVKKWWKQLVCVCVCRSFLDLCDPGLLSSHQRELVYLPQPIGGPFVPLQATVPQRSVLLLPSDCTQLVYLWSCTVIVCISSPFGLSHSDNSCTSHLPVCLACADCFMGFPDLAARGWKANWRLLLLGNRVRLRLLPLHLHPHLGKSDVLSWGWLKHHHRLDSGNLSVQRPVCFSVN